MDLNALKLFVEIVDAGNLSAAARKLQTTRSNVSHRLKAFERALGVQLLRRTTRRVEPTEVGAGIYEHGRSILREMAAADALVSSLGKSLQGSVRLSVPTGLGHLLVSRLLVAFKRAYPDNRLDVRSGTIRVRATLDNADGRLTPGLYARVRMSTGAPHDAILISDKAIGTDQDKKFVLVVDAANKTSYRAVTVGASIDGLRVVKSGLKAGDRIVVNGIQRVRPGDAVAPNAVTMDSLVTKRVVLPGVQPEAPAGSAQPAAEAKADTTTAPAAKAETKPANAKTAANAQRLPADRA